jgi:ribosomal protein S21
MAFVEINSRDPRRHREDLDWALREFKKQVKKEDILKDLRKYEYFVSPSRKRRIKSAESLKQRKRDERKSQWQNKKFDNLF